MDDREDLDETRASPASEPQGSIDHGRYPPGTMLASRYRIVGLLGRGGMGEVFRADDLKLGETVALKFLPERLARDGAALARFHREVRVARQVTHRNIVRVHDIGEADGATFIAMEYVDGEDLASLLRRIGRLPSAKAHDVARQLCAGLSAAHERGVVHRDLKPANVMIDGRGQVRISDFGLAQLADDGEGGTVGTPAYMAPEQLRGEPASVASDLYALGLVLMELYGGGRALPSTLGELRSFHASHATPDLSSLDSEEPLVASAVAACLHPDADARPASALEVLARLPGGDPLAAALAAGETPSPEMVARARRVGTLPLPLSLTMLGVLLLNVALWLAHPSAITVDGVPLEPAVMLHRAAELLRAEGYDDEALRHRRWSYDIDARVARREVRAPRRSVAELHERAERRPALVEFWARFSATPLVPTRRFSWRVRPDDPPLSAPGVATVRLDSDGRLLSLIAPPISGARSAAADWSSALDAAGIDAEGLEAIEPTRPPIFAQTLRAWRGVAADGEAFVARAAADAGRLVYFDLDFLDEPPPGAPRTIAAALSFFALMLLGGAVQARRNLISGRADLRGANRLAAAMGAATLIRALLLAHHSTGPAELSLLFAILASALLLSGTLWLAYVGVEPLMRRVGATQLVSWSRLVSGTWRDPLVARDLLIGLSFTSLPPLLFAAFDRLTGRYDLQIFWPHGLGSLHGPMEALIENTLLPVIIIVPFCLLFVLAVASAIFRDRRLAYAATFLTIGGFDLLISGPSLQGLLMTVAIFGSLVAGGFVGAIGSTLVVSAILLAPSAGPPGPWWAANVWIGLTPIVALGIGACLSATRRTKST